MYMLLYMIYEATHSLSMSFFLSYSHTPPSPHTRTHAHAHFLVYIGGAQCHANEHLPARQGGLLPPTSCLARYTASVQRPRHCPDARVRICVKYVAKNLLFYIYLTLICYFF